MYEGRGEDHQKNLVFEVLEEITSFYENFSQSSQYFSLVESEEVSTINTPVYSSIQEILEPLKWVLGKGRIEEAFKIVNKYYDAVIVDIYTHLYSQNYEEAQINDFLEEKREIDNLPLSPLFEPPHEMRTWLKEKDTLSYHQFCMMLKYIENSVLKPILRALFKDRNYEQTWKRYNGSVQDNFFHDFSVQNNKGSFSPQDRIKLFGYLKKDLENIFILHLSCIFFLNDHYRIPRGSLDTERPVMHPEEEVKCIVSPFIQRIFEDMIERQKSDISELMKLNPSMQLH